MAQELVKQEERESRAPIAAGGTVRAIVPQSFDEMWRVAGALIAGGITPEGLGDQNKVMIALMAGAEAGLSPMASVQGIMIVNKRPAIWGDAALALVLGSGLAAEHDETFVGDGDKVKAVCSIERKGRKRPIVREFSLDDAKAAGLMGKDTWRKYPKRMLQMRARAWALRDGFADVLKGLHIVEEARDIPEATANTIAPPAPKDEEVVDAVAEEVTHTAEAEPAASSEPEEEKPADDGPPPPPDDEEEKPQTEGDATENLGPLPDNFVDDVASALDNASETFDLEEYWEEIVDPWWDKIPESDREFLQATKAKTAKRIAP